VVGYDGRHNSERWAELTAAIFISKGFTVYKFTKLAATPLVVSTFLIIINKLCMKPFVVLQKGAAAGVMVTASHNPKDDNGYKVYWSNGCQVQTAIRSISVTVSRLSLLMILEYKSAL
jgi:phosphoglucomutase